MSGRPRRRRSGAAALLVAGALAGAGCTTVGEVTNLAEPRCAEELRSGLAGILAQQGETAEAAGRLAERSVETLAAGELGPRPFLLAAPSGTDYSFFVEVKDGRCLLRLYGRQKGFVSYTNNLTYIATRDLPSCACSG